jgi:hypothetical protein
MTLPRWGVGLVSFTAGTLLGPSLWSSVEIALLRDDFSIYGCKNLIRKVPEPGEKVVLLSLWPNEPKYVCSELVEKFIPGESILVWSIPAEKP